MAPASAANAGSWNARSPTCIGSAACASAGRSAMTSTKRSSRSAACSSAGGASSPVRPPPATESLLSSTLPEGHAARTWASCRRWASTQSSGRRTNTQTEVRDTAVSLTTTSIALRTSPREMYGPSGVIRISGFRPSSIQRTGWPTASSSSASAQSFRSSGSRHTSVRWPFANSLATTMSTSRQPSHGSTPVVGPATRTTMLFSSSARWMRSTGPRSVMSYPLGRVHVSTHHAHVLGRPVPRESGR